MTKFRTPTKANHNMVVSERGMMASKSMTKVNKPTSRRLDTKEIKVPIDGLIRCNPNPAKTVATPQQRDAVMAS